DQVQRRRPASLGRRGEELLAAEDLLRRRRAASGARRRLGVRSLRPQVLGRDRLRVGLRQAQRRQSARGEVSRMRFTFRNKLMAIAGIAAGELLLALGPFSLLA